MATENCKALVHADFSDLINITLVNRAAQKGAVCLDGSPAVTSMPRDLEKELIIGRFISRVVDGVPKTKTATISQES